MRGAPVVMIAAITCLALSGCAYKPLKAPCAPDEDDRPLSYTDGPPAPTTPEPLRALDACGPMKPI